MSKMLKILIVTDKFKGSLTASQAAESIKSGLLSGSVKTEIIVVPMADGGEGTMEVVKNSIGGELFFVKVSDPLNREINAPYLKNGGKILIEMAKCSGLGLLRQSEYNPSITSSFGLGQMIIAAAKEKPQEIIIGIGGSATNDGGMGLLKAIGYRFNDVNGKEAVSLADVRSIEDKEVSGELNDIKIKVACDVNNPLTGERGATRVYGPQKGADPEMISTLEEGMKNYAQICDQYLGSKYSLVSGSGAAGGVGFALAGFLGAELLPGWKVLAEYTDLEHLIKESDLVITGEGSVDEQSISGKLLDGVASLTKKYSKILWVFCGINNLNKEELLKLGVSKLFSISDLEADKEVSIREAKKYLEKNSSISATFLNQIESNRQTD
jgi:glycerate kinase